MLYYQSWLITSGVKEGALLQTARHNLGNVNLNGETELGLSVRTYASDRAAVCIRNC